VEKVIIEKSVIDYFDNLVFNLFDQDYFGFVESALDYVARILSFIQSDLPKKQHKKTPIELLKYGTYYTSYKANTSTTWYIFFETSKDKYVVRKILNNHLQEIQFLNL
jgi:hypothetical protein